METEWKLIADETHRWKPTDPWPSFACSGCGAIMVERGTRTENYSVAVEGRTTSVTCASCGREFSTITRLD